MRVSEITLCEDVVFDEKTKLQSLIGIRDYFRVPVFPCVIGSLCVSIAFELDGGEPDGQDVALIGILDLDGLTVSTSEKTIQWKPGYRNMRIYFRSGTPIMVEESGVLTATIKLFPTVGVAAEKSRDFGISLRDPDLPPDFNIIQSS